MTIAWPTEDPDLPPPPRKKPWIWPALTGAAAVVAVAVVALVLPSQAPVVATPVAATAPTTPPPTSVTPPATETFDGNGDGVVELKRAGLPSVLTFECPKCTGNVLVESQGTPLIKAVGAYTGNLLINVDVVTTTLKITGKGAWKLSVAGPETVPAMSGQAKGRGDAVVMLTSTFTSAKITNQGKGTFSVKHADLSTKRLVTAVTRTGNYQGTIPLPGPCLVQIQSTGTWTITPK